MKAIEIEIGNEYKIKFEKNSQLNNSVFHNLYVSAARTIQEILEQQNKPKLAYEFFKDGDYNNLIGFVGERGSGKSSSMLSFAQALIDSSKNEFDGDIFNDYPLIKQTSFVSIDVVDPSLFSHKDTLFEIIVSKMFASFRHEMKTRDQKDQNEKRELVSLFQEVFKNLKTIHEGKSDLYQQDVIEALDRFANGTNLRNNYHKLVLEYLKFFGKTNGTLLIVIDDFDLRISEAYSMLEDIRQFLIQRNIIVLLGCKIEQLAESVELRVKNEFREITTVETAKEKSNKYLQKLLPTDHRKNTPSLTLNGPLNNVKQDKATVNKFIVKQSNNVLIQATSLQEGILKLIYERLNLFISLPEFNQNFTTPKTIRELIDIVSFVHRLSADDLEVFTKFFLLSVSQQFDSEIITFFYDLDQLPATQINAYAKAWVKKRFESQQKPVVSSNQRTAREVPVRFPNLTDSLGAVLAYLDELKTNTSITALSELNLIACLKMFYSIRVQTIIHNEDFDVLDFLVQGDLLKQPTLIFPRFKTEYRRDVFQVRAIPLLKAQLSAKEIDINDLTFVVSFISFFGRENNRLNKPISFNDGRFLNRLGPSVEWVTFNALSFIYHLKFHDLLQENLRLLAGNDDKDWKLLNEIKEWVIPQSYYLFYNADFLQEFLDELEVVSSNHKDQLGDYGDTLFVFLVDGSKRALEALNIKYPYLNFGTEEFLANPIFKYWQNNKKKINGMLDIIFGSYTSGASNPQDLKKLAAEFISKYETLFSSEGEVDAKYARSTATKIVTGFKLFPKNAETLQSYRDVMSKDVKVGLQQMNVFLKKLADG